MAAASRLTAELPGTGGRLKETPEDFRVEEIALYPASGAGEHLFLTVEKRGISTLELVQRLARALGVRRNDLGWAGLKDAQAVTVQTISVPRAAQPRIAGLEIDNARIVDCVPHRNKLKLGHLAGNRFTIRVRGVGESALARANAVLALLAQRGVPNRFGAQRFGSRGGTARLGRAVLAGDGRALFRELIATSSQPNEALAAFDAGNVAGARDRLAPADRETRASLEFLARHDGDCAVALARFDRKRLALFASAVQAELFNDVLERRMPAIDTVEAGDLAWLHRNGAVFAVIDPVVEAPRVSAFEISPSGPLFGARMISPSGRPRGIEEEALAAAGLTAANFDKAPLPGCRRPLRIPLREPRAGFEDSTLCVSFSLPPGAYATVVLDEIMKADAPTHT